jgi:hypothetical protein
MTLVTIKRIPGASRLNVCVVLSVFAALCLVSPGAFPSADHSESGRMGPGGYMLPFFPNGTYDSSIPSPDDFLGHPVAESPVRYHKLIAYLKELAASTPTVEMVEYGHTHEGRALYYLVLSSRENMERIGEIKNSIGRLANPRDLSGSEAERIIANTPAVAWMAYSIHGDELSSTDAAMQLAYQLAAGTDDLTELLRRELVVIIDPLQNPDGRERFLAMMQQVQGTTSNWDSQSLQHTGYWSSGRGNHYLFDLNRDWFIQVHPETKSKVRAIVEWNPQVLVDCHEMGALDTYMFSPPREPFNPNMNERMKKWWRVFADDQAAAFDSYGWSYYTREWNEEWFPGYGSSWSLYLGALGILYEQAGVEGSLIKRHDGTYLTYRESAHHQFVSSMANIESTARNRAAILEDFYREKANSLKGKLGSKDKAIVFAPGVHPERAEKLAASLMRQGIEVHVATEDLKAGGLRDYWGDPHASGRLKAGTYVVPLNQPMGLLAKTLLEFDPRMSTKSLEKERYELEKNRRSRIYDVTAWSLPIAMGLEAYSASSPVRGDLVPAGTEKTNRGALHNRDASYGYLIDGRSDRALAAAAAIMEAGYKVRHSRKPSRAAGVDFARGSFLMRKAENPDGLADLVERVCESTGVHAYGVNSALAESGADLGGRLYRLLETPRVCLLAGSPISSSSYGAIWHMLDHALGMRSSRMDVSRLARADLNKYNVIIMPTSWGGAYNEVLGKGGVRNLTRWIEEGGTLIAMGSAATTLADTSLGLSKVKLRRQVLSRLDAYEAALGMEPESPSPVDSLEVWEARPAKSKKKEKEEEETKKSPRKSKAELLAEDERLRLFRPRGAMMRVELDEEHWLASGAGNRVPALMFASHALMSKHPVETVGRFGGEDEIRIAGLMWPEARTRWARTAYLTRESRGKGQIVLFLNEPYFRAQFLGTGRLLMNAIVLGPGLGTTRPQPW